MTIALAIILPLVALLISWRLYLFVHRQQVEEDGLEGIVPFDLELRMDEIDLMEWPWPKR